jgi:hypothetical protein
MTIQFKKIFVECIGQFPRKKLKKYISDTPNNKNDIIQINKWINNLFWKILFAQ